MYHNPLFIKAFYLCEIADEPLLWRNYNRVFDKLYVFYCAVSRNFLHTFYFRSSKKCCCTVICEHGSFYWAVSSWPGKNGFERKINFIVGGDFMRWFELIFLHLPRVGGGFLELLFW